uniref:Methyltransferase n=1 Tax=Anisakis simplex TaxID=6269 RepID=A0A0M3JIC0_ANISI
LLGFIVRAIRIDQVLVRDVVEQNEKTQSIQVRTRNDLGLHLRLNSWSD